MNDDKVKSKKSVCEEQNYQRVFESYSKDIYRYLYYRIGNEELAKDMVQDAYIKLWENCSKVPFDKVKFYLLRLVKNKSIDYYRTKKINIDYNEANLKRVENETPDFLLQEKEYKEKLTAVINKMPEKFRVTFLMNRIDGKKYREIAEILDISVKTVEFRMQKALAFLKKELGAFNK